MESSTNNVSSSYWKIPDNNSYLSAVVAHETDPLVAVASGSADSNLFVYQLDVNTATKKPVLTHHQTITLPGIHSLAWASPRQSLGRYGYVLASGHKSGLMHLTLLPDPSSDHEPAEILRRFNHNKHLAESEPCKSTRIRNLSIVSSKWNCCAESALLTLFNESIYLWDPARSDVPVLKKRARGTQSVDPSPLRDGVVSLGGSKGVSIMDLRVRDPRALSPPEGNDTVVNQVSWSPHDENQLASVHERNIVKVWDIRAGKPLVTLSNHRDRVNALEWSDTDPNEFYSASSDGTIRTWDIQSCADPPPTKPLRIPSTSSSSSSNRAQPLSSSNPNPASAISPGSSSLDWLPKPLEKLSHRMSLYDDCFVLKAPVVRQQLPVACVYSNGKDFSAITPLRAKSQRDDTHTRIVSIDTDGFFGLHTAPKSDDALMRSESLMSSESGSSDDDENVYSSASSSCSSSPQLETRDIINR